MRNCKHCGQPIPEGRLKALPGTDTCVLCSTTNKKRGFRVITGKTTYSQLDIVNEETWKKLTHLQSRRGQSPGNGVIMGKSRTIKQKKK